MHGPGNRVVVLPYSGKEMVKSLSNHGPDPLVAVALFVLVVAGATLGADRYILIGGLVCILLMYHIRRSAAEASAERLASLPLAETERKIAVVKESHRASLVAEQQTLDLAPRPRTRRQP